LGTRFWPKSSQKMPKQFLYVFGKETLIQQTYRRAKKFTHPNDIYICALKDHLNLLENQLPECNNYILEPTSKNTAPCLMLSVHELIKNYPPETPMIVLPADHYIGKEEKFKELVERAKEFVSKNPSIVTFGIRPSFPSTGYGYIDVDRTSGIEGFFSVKQFIEKPSYELANKLISQNSCWNSGIFAWSLETISECFKKFLPVEWSLFNNSQDSLEKIYEKITPISIDIAVMEKAKNVFLLDSEIDWSDVGSWSTLYELHKPKWTNHVVLSGNIASAESKNCFIDVPKWRKVALVGVEDLVIIENEESLLILKRGLDQLVREVQKEFPL